MTLLVNGDDDVVRALSSARQVALALFDEIEQRLVRPGVSESELTRAINALARERFGIKLHWHKRLVRAGPNTMLGFAAEPPDRVIEADDVVFVDLGPVLAEWEADLGRTYVLGLDPRKRQLRTDLPRIFEMVAGLLRAQPDITGADLYAYAVATAERMGWQFGSEIAGHIIGEFPHKRVPTELRHSYIGAANERPLSDLDSRGRVRHWIVEIHLVDPERGFGGFYEDLVTF